MDGTVATRDAHVSSLGYALLCLLARRDRTGYELSQFTKPPRNHLLWSAGHSQIYPELAKLSEAGLVTFSEVAQASRPDKKVYRLTDMGRRNLRSWVLKPPKPAPFRNELTLKAHASWLVDPEEGAAMFRARMEIAEDEIEMIRDHQRNLETRYGAVFPPPVDNPLFGTYANLKFAIDSRKQLIEWCRWMENELMQAAPATVEKTI